MAYQMTMNLSKMVADVLLHRLQVLIDPGHLREVFEGHENLDMDLLEESAINYHDAFSSGSLSVSVTTDEDLEIIVACLEGSTYFGTPTNSEKERLRKVAVQDFARKLGAATNQTISVSLS